MAESCITDVLDERELLGRAQGVIMERDQSTERAALAAMHVCAYKLDIDIALVAAAIVTAAGRPGGLGRPDVDHALRRSTGIAQPSRLGRAPRWATVRTSLATASATLDRIMQSVTRRLRSVGGN